MKNLNPSLMVTDIKKSIEFYQNVLGFKTTMTFPQQAPYQWVCLQQENMILMLVSRAGEVNQLPTIAKRDSAGTLAFYTSIEDAESTFNKIKDKATVIHGVRGTFYGTKEFAVEDPDGFVWVFSQNVSCDCPESYSTVEASPV